MAARVTYFQGYGRAEFIRAMFEASGVAYTNEEISQEEWPAIKASGRFQFGSMPEVELDGVKMNQSRSAARAVAIKFGYYSTDPDTIHAIDALLDYNQENFDKTVMYIFDQDKNEEKDNAWLQHWKAKGDLLENRLKQHGNPWLAGTTKPTLCDFSVVAHYYSAICNEASAFGPLCQRVKDEVLSQQPLMKRYLEETVVNDASMKSYFEKKQERGPRPF